MVRALTIVADQTKNRYFKEIVHTIVSDLEEGMTLSAALLKFPRIFGQIFISVVRAGEQSGKLDMVLEQQAKQLEEEANFVARIRAALLYPAFIIFAMIVVAILMLTKVVPQLEQIFKESGAQLPLATRILVWLANFVISDWVWIIVVLILLIFGIRFYLRTLPGRILYSQIQVYTPLVKFISQDVYLARLTRTLSMLVGAGVPIIDSLEITAKAMNNLLYESSLKDVSDQLERGVPISVPMSQDKLYPPILPQMILVGEETGKLDETLKTMAHHFEVEADTKIKGFTSLFEPVIIVILGIGVGFMVFAVLMPIYNLAQLE